MNPETLVSLLLRSLMGDRRGSTQEEAGCPSAEVDHRTNRGGAGKDAVAALVGGVVGEADVIDILDIIRRKAIDGGGSDDVPDDDLSTAVDTCNVIAYALVGDGSVAANAIEIDGATRVEATTTVGRASVATEVDMARLAVLGGNGEGETSNGIVSGNNGITQERFSDVAGAAAREQRDGAQGSKSKCKEV